MTVYDAMTLLLFCNYDGCNTQRNDRHSVIERHTHSIKYILASTEFGTPQPNSIVREDPNTLNIGEIINEKKE